MISVTTPDRSMRMNASGAKTADGLSPAAPANGMRKPNSNTPPVAAAPVLRNARRDALSGACSTSTSVMIDAPAALHGFGRLLDRFADAQIGAAAADVPSHRGVDIRVVR